MLTPTLKQPDMTLKQFNSLRKAAKVNVVEKCGVLVICKTHTPLNYELYQVYSFYVEIIRNQVTGKIDTLHKVHAFRETAMLLDLYIADIDISQLLAKCNK